MKLSQQYLAVLDLLPRPSLCCHFLWQFVSTLVNLEIKEQTPRKQGSWTFFLLMPPTVRTLRIKPARCTVTSSQQVPPITGILQEFLINCNFTYKYALKGDFDFSWNTLILPFFAQGMDYHLPTASGFLLSCFPEFLSEKTFYIKIYL